MIQKISYFFALYGLLIVYSSQCMLSMMQRATLQTNLKNALFYKKLGRSMRNVSTHNCKAKRAIIVGASSGMGKQVAKLLSNEGYILGLTSHKEELLKPLQQEITGVSYIRKIDVIDVKAREQFIELVKELGGLDLLVISISAYHDNTISNTTDQLTWEEKQRTLRVDAYGVIALADVAFDYFMKQNSGHFVGISSTSGLRGSAATPVYSAAKSCISCYMEAMRNYMTQNNINVQVTDVIPGWVAVEHSPLGTDSNAYWEIEKEKAGQAIVNGIKRKDKKTYVPSKVGFIAFLLRHMPDWFYNKYFPWI